MSASSGEEISRLYSGGGGSAAGYAYYQPYEPGSTAIAATRYDLHSHPFPISSAVESGGGGGGAGGGGGGVFPLSAHSQAGPGGYYPTATQGAATGRNIFPSYSPYLMIDNNVCIANVNGSSSTTVQSVSPAEQHHSHLHHQRSQLRVNSGVGVNSDGIGAATNLTTPSSILTNPHVAMRSPPASMAAAYDSGGVVSPPDGAHHSHSAYSEHVGLSAIPSRRTCTGSSSSLSLPNSPASLSNNSTEYLLPTPTTSARRRISNRDSNLKRRSNLTSLFQTLQSLLTNPVVQPMVNDEIAATRRGAFAPIDAGDDVSSCDSPLPGNQSSMVSSGHVMSSGQDDGSSAILSRKLYSLPTTTSTSGTPTFSQIQILQMCVGFLQKSISNNSSIQGNANANGIGNGGTGSDRPNNKRARTDDAECERAVKLAACSSRKGEFNGAEDSCYSDSIDAFCQSLRSLCYQCLLNIANTTGSMYQPCDSVAVSIVAITGEVLHVNDLYCEMFQWRHRSEVVGRAVSPGAAVCLKYARQMASTFLTQNNDPVAAAVINDTHQLPSPHPSLRNITHVGYNNESITELYLLLTRQKKTVTIRSRNVRGDGILVESSLTIWFLTSDHACAPYAFPIEKNVYVIGFVTAQLPSSLTTLPSLLLP